MSNASIPDAYGFMGMGVAFISAGVVVLVNAFLSIGTPFLLAIVLLLAGVILFMVGRAHEKEVLRSEVSDA